MGQVGFLQPVDHPGHHCRLHSGEAVLREVNFFQAHVFSQNLKGLLRLAGSDPAVDHACRLKVVNGSSHVSAGNAGQRCSPKKKVADRGGGCCKGGKEGKQVESSKAAVGELQPGQAVLGQLLELNSRHKAQVVLRHYQLPHLFKLGRVQQGYCLEIEANFCLALVHTCDLESLFPLSRILLMRPRAVARSRGGTSSKVVNDKLSSSRQQLGSESRKNSWSFCQSIKLVINGKKESKPEVKTEGRWGGEIVRGRSRRRCTL